MRVQVAANEYRGDEPTSDPRPLPVMIAPGSAPTLVGKEGSDVHGFENANKLLLLGGKYVDFFFKGWNLYPLHTSRYQTINNPLHGALRNSEHLTRISKTPSIIGH